MEMKPISEAFAGMEEPRDGRNLKYPLIDVLNLAVYGTLCGYRDFTNMAYFLKKKEAELSEKFRLANGVPSHDVFSDVFRLLDVQVFLERFTDWLSGVLSGITGEHVAIDGKAVRAATEKAARGRVPYVVSAFACGLGISVCQLEIGDKGNEITDIPKLIEMMDVRGCTVTIDAIGTQHAIMDLIVGKGGHFCLQLKRNQPTAFEGAEMYFADQLARVAQGRPHDALDEYRKVDGGHGRVEVRTYRTLTDASQVRLALPDGWDHVRCLGMAVLDRSAAGDPSRRSVEAHLHVMDEAMTAEEYAGYARRHWRQENTLHHVLDVQFGEDACTARADNAISNLTLLRKMAFNIVGQVKGRKSTRAVMTDFMMDADLFLPFLYERVPVGVADGSISV